jgi:chromosomal replication initiation ATPase DnaA
VKEITQRSRRKTVSEARCAVYWLARKLTRLSYPEIAHELGRDHTTVMNGVESIDGRRLQDEWLAQNLDAILHTLNPNEVSTQ